MESSSGTIGNAVNQAVGELVPLIAPAPAEVAQRSWWLERLWEAYAADSIPYIETLADFWGELCANHELASAWADALIDDLRRPWMQGWSGHYFQGATVCLSSRLAARRYQELLVLVDRAPFVGWECRRWVVKALAAMGKHREAIEYAEASRGLNDDPARIARACEEILLSIGEVEEVYQRYAIAANPSNSNLATYRAILRKYRAIARERILRDLIASTQGEGGKWFAAAKEAGLMELALDLANRSPTDPRTLTRAARDFKDTNPAFAIEAGLAALRWLGEGYGYQVTGADDVWAAYSRTIDAAERLGRPHEIHTRIQGLVPATGFVARVLAGKLRPKKEPEPVKR